MTTVFEEKNVSKAILRVAFPAMLGQLTTLIYNMADTYFVSLTREPATIAAVTLSAPILLIIMSIAAIFGMGGSSVIARMLGEGKKQYAAKTLNFCVYAMILFGVLTLVFGVSFLELLARLAGADVTNLMYTSDYLKYVFYGAPFIVLANGFVHLFRSVGMIKEGTTGLILGNAINIVLDYLFIVQFGWQTAGAALATSLGFGCATLYYVICMVREERKGNELISLSPKYFTPDSNMIQSVVSIGIPGALITVLMSVANMVLNNYIGIYGSDAVASYGIAYRLNMIPILLSVGLSQGVTLLIGYYYGAGKSKKMEDIMKYSMLYSILLGMAFTISFLLFGKNFAAIFLSDEDLITQSGYFLSILCLSVPILGVINMTTSYFQALGKAIHSLAITLLRNAVLFVPGVILLNSMWNLNGVIAAQPIVEGLLTIICIIMYVKAIKSTKITTNNM